MGKGERLNPAKSELVLFSRRNRGSTRVATLELSTESKYLGVVLNSKHSQKIKSKERMKKLYVSGVFDHTSSNFQTVTDLWGTFGVD